MALEEFEESEVAATRRMGGLEKSVLGILVLIVFLFTLLLILGSGLTRRNPKTRAGSESAAVVLPVAPPARMEPPALAALEAFFEAPDLASKATLVRDSERVRPMMEDYHHRRGHPFPTLGRVSPPHHNRSATPFFPEGLSARLAINPPGSAEAAFPSLFLIGRSDFAA